MPSIRTVIAFCIVICWVESQETIRCGETKTGSRNAKEEVKFIFTSTASYNEVYLEGCQSTHDIWLEIQDSNSNTIADADDQFNHNSQTNCGNPNAGDITIPGSVSNGDIYTFIIKGYRRSNGPYNVQLICNSNNSPIPAPTTPTTPAPIPSTAAFITCGETKQGIRSNGEEIEFIFKSTTSYQQVYLEGCQSDYDLLLKIKELGLEADDTNDFGPSCTNTLAADIAIPNTVSSGDIYTFVVSGYTGSGDDDAIGAYSVTLMCSENAPTPQPVDPTSCGRHREAWHLISNEDRELYINGFKQLARDGKIATFTETHRFAAEHGNAAFLPWHRYFIWEFETQMRALGDEYTCFGLPYWDWTYDIQQHEYDVADYFILNSGLSGDGIGSDNCVSGNFGSDEYTPTYSLGANCLERDICDRDCNYGDSSASELMAIISQFASYGDDDDNNAYRGLLEGAPHGWAHTVIGGSGHLGLVAFSTDDPIFYLLHSMVDYQYSLWQDCRDHEQVDNHQITTAMYGGSSTATRLDTIMDLGSLESVSWSYVSENAMSIREMHDNTDWSVSYDVGDFFDRAQVENNNVCAGNINDDWFKDITRRRRRRLMNGVKTNEAISEYEEYSQDIFNRLHKRSGGKYKSMRQNEELYKTWAQMNCQYLSMENNCIRPKYFDDCSDMERHTDIGYNGYYDIDIRLDELIEKVSDYPCMIETRRKLYNWTKSTGNLYGLCRGQYDRFCDKDYRMEKSEDKCMQTMKKKLHLNST